MSPDRDEHSVRHEPTTREASFGGDSVHDEPAHGNYSGRAQLEEAAEHNVWDEPVTSAGGRRPPADAITYATWYRLGLERTAPGTTYAVVFGLAMAGGLFAIVGSLISISASSVFELLTVVLLAPAIEEMLKIAAVLIVLERRPFFFRNSGQLLAAILASALVFAIVENIIYINFYVPDHTPEFVTWRWTVCTFMHVGCSAIAGLGARRVWRASRRDLSRPRVDLALPYTVTAFAIHGVYNLFASTVAPALVAF